MERSVYEEKLKGLLDSGRILMYHPTRKDSDGDTLHDAVPPGSVPTFLAQGWKKAAPAPVEIEKETDPTAKSKDPVAPKVEPVSEPVNPIDTTPPAKDADEKGEPETSEGKAVEEKEPVKSKAKPKAKPGPKKSS